MCLGAIGLIAIKQDRIRQNSQGIPKMSPHNWPEVKNYSIYLRLLLYFYIVLVEFVYLKLPLIFFSSYGIYKVEIFTAMRYGLFIYKNIQKGYFGLRVKGKVNSSELNEPTVERVKTYEHIKFNGHDCMIMHKWFIQLE